MLPLRVVVAAVLPFAKAFHSFPKVRGLPRSVGARMLCIGRAALPRTYSWLLKIARFAGERDGSWCRAPMGRAAVWRWLAIAVWRNGRLVLLRVHIFRSATNTA